MKRASNLMEKIADMDNLYLAWTKSKRGKKANQEVLNYEKDLDFNLKKLQNQLTNKEDLAVGNYHYFIVSDPKIRKICAASFPERVLHHALMNVCDKYFEKHLIFDSYATRRKKGTYAALDRAKVFVKKYEYFVKLDVSKYFDNIDHQILKKQLQKQFKDKELLAIFGKIIDSYQIQENKGIPIGNLTSQYFANHYLSLADHFAKEHLKLKGYIRYMDDIIFFGNDKMKLLEEAKQFSKFVWKHLQLEFKAMVHARVLQGLPFLGYKLFPHTVKLNQRSKKRFKIKLKHNQNKLNSHQWTAKEYQEHTLPLLSFVEYADTLNFRKKCSTAFQAVLKIIDC